jgi:hypothetical protein
MARIPGSSDGTTDHVAAAATDETPDHLTGDPWASGPQ